MFRVLDDAMIDRHRRNPGTPYSICDGYWWREDGWGVVGFARVVTGREAREGGTPSPREGTPGWVEREAIRGTEERGGQDPLWRLCGSLKRAAFGDGGFRRSVDTRRLPMRRTIPKAPLHYALRLPHGRLKGSQVAMPKEPRPLRGRSSKVLLTAAARGHRMPGLRAGMDAMGDWVKGFGNAYRPRSNLGLSGRV